FLFLFFFSSRRRHTRFSRDWSSDVCSSDLRPSSMSLPKNAHLPSFNTQISTLAELGMAVFTEAVQLSPSSADWLVCTLVGESPLSRINATMVPSFLCASAGCMGPLPTMGRLGRQVSPSSSEMATRDILNPSEYNGSNILPLLVINGFMRVIHPMLRLRMSLPASMIILSYWGAYSAQP